MNRAILLIMICLVGFIRPLQSDIPKECSVIPEIDKERLKEYLKNPFYGSGVRAFLNRSWGIAAYELEKGWSKVSRRLATVFANDKCDPTGIRDVLSKTVFSKPHLAVPREDRFLPPQEITWALGYALCAQGKLERSARVLIQLGITGDYSSLSAGIVLLASSKKIEAAKALLEARKDVPTLKAADIFVSALSDNKIPPIQMFDDPQAKTIIELIKERFQ